MCNTAMAWVLIIIFLSAMFVLFAYLQQISGGVNLKYPPTQDCDQINPMFATEKLAPFYYDFAEQDLKYTNQAKGTGVYQCFCELNAKNATFAGFITSSENSTAAEELCHDWKHALRGGSAISSGVSFAVTLVNMIIRTMNIFLLSKVGYHTYSA